MQVQSISEAERQRQYYDHKANAISLEPRQPSLGKTQHQKVKDWWGGGTVQSGTQDCQRHPLPAS